jgi:O-antigen ligase
VHGLSVGDLIFLGWTAFTIADVRRRKRWALAFQSVIEHTTLLVSFALLLLVSVAVNAFRYGASWADFVPILRLFYFSLIVAFTASFVRKFGGSWLTLAFLTGIAWLALDQLHYSLTTGRAMFGIPLLRDPNVVGNMLAVGVLVASIGIIAGRPLMYLPFAVAFAVMTVTTFSKGAWLMVALGLAANLVVLRVKFAPSPKGLRRLAVAMLLVIGTLGGFAYRDARELKALWELKKQTTEDNATVQNRYAFAVAGMQAMFDHPVFGVGYRNFIVTSRLYPDVLLEPSENAHNVFVEIGAVGGVPAVFVWLILFVYPFPQLWRIVRDPQRYITAPLYVALSALVFTVSGAVQLQLVAQPFFWFFTGLVRGLALRHFDAASRQAKRASAVAPVLDQLAG